jgi:hypothetical protein
MSWTATPLTEQVEESLLLLGCQYVPFSEEMVNDQQLHLALSGEDLFLLGGDGLTVNLGSGEQVDQLGTLAADLLTGGLGGLPEGCQAGLDLLPLFRVSSKLLVQRAGDPALVSSMSTRAMLCPAARDGTSGPDSDECQVKGNAHDNEPGNKLPKHVYRSFPPRPETSAK